MPATNFPEYARGIEDVLDAIVAAGEAVLRLAQFEQRYDVDTVHFLQEMAAEDGVCK